MYRAKKGVYNPDALYDKVLVDAQCTHDGSVKHVLKVWPIFNLLISFSLRRMAGRKRILRSILPTIWINLSDCRYSHVRPSPTEFNEV